MTVDVLLSRLNGVRRTGRGWIALCPSHADHSASLSVAETENGRTLLHCFAGCSAADVVAAIGLTLADLFPERVRDYSSLDQARRRAAMLSTNVVAACNVLGFEASIVAIAGSDLLQASEGVLTPADRDRLAQAFDRIQGVRSVLNDRPIESRDYERVMEALRRGAAEAVADAELWAARRRRAA